MPPSKPPANTTPQRKKSRSAVKRSHPLRRQITAAAMKKLAAKVRKDLKVDVVNLRKKALPIEYLSTGFQELDDALSSDRDDNMDIIEGSGRGFPRGRIIEIFGPESAAKTTLTLAVIAHAQSLGEACAFIDAEHALDLQYAQNAMGVDPKRLLVFEPDNGEEAIEELEWCIREKFSVIVVDSVAALLTKAEQEGGKALGEQARLMSKTCRKLTSHLKSGGPMVIFINQIRYKIGVMFGNPEMTSGGNALKFYASIRATVRKQRELKRSSKKRLGSPLVVGDRIQLRVIKNKVAPRDGRVLFDVMFGKGIRIPKVRARKTTKAEQEE